MGDAPLAAGEPRWILEAGRAALGEARLSGQTVWRFTSRPSEFARQWAAGAERAMNPVGLLATSAALVAATTSLAARVRGREGGNAWKP